jgi:tricorn protease
VEPESGLSWSPDSKALVFAAERNGQTDLCLVNSDDPNEPRLRRTNKLKREWLTQTETDESSPRFAPDGKKLAFRRGTGDLVVLDVETAKSACWSKAGTWAISSGRPIVAGLP